MLETNKLLETQARCSAVARKDRYIRASQTQRHIDIDNHDEQRGSPTSSTTESSAYATATACGTGCRVVQS